MGEADDQEEVSDRMAKIVEDSRCRTMTTTMQAQQVVGICSIDVLDPIITATGIHETTSADMERTLTSNEIPGRSGGERMVTREAVEVSTRGETITRTILGAVDMEGMHNRTRATADLDNSKCAMV